MNYDTPLNLSNSHFPMDDQLTTETKHATCSKDDKDSLDVPRDVGTATTLVTVAPEQAEDDDFPDGGLRAWLVVFGVSCVVPNISSISI